MAPNIYALPGMGADQRMFPEPWNKLPGFVAVNWSAAAGARTLIEVAHSVVDIHRIKEGDIVLGTSLGGIVGAEIARLRPLSRLILIGSAIDRSEVNPLLTILAGLVDHAPIELLKHSAASVPADVCQMFSHTHADFIRAMCREIAAWRGYSVGPERLHRIHGRHDCVIPIPSQVDHIIDGGHLITMTHAAECAGVVRRICAGHPTSPSRLTH